jgi:crotonobetainyl-CoA:carnitine CoA-transferase CaiB-like acyl-CoA transferase
MSVMGGHYGRPIQTVRRSAAPACYWHSSILSALFRQKTATVSGDAIFDHALQARHVHHAGAHRCCAAPPPQPTTDNPAGGTYTSEPGGPNDYLDLLTQPRQARHWPRLLKPIGREDLIRDIRYNTLDARSKWGAEVDGIISDWTQQHIKLGAMTQLSAVGVLEGAVFDYSNGADHRAKLPSRSRTVNTEMTMHLAGEI